MRDALASSDGAAPQSPRFSNEAVGPMRRSFDQHDVAVTTSPQNRHGARKKNPGDNRPNPFDHVPGARDLPKPTPAGPNPLRGSKAARGSKWWQGWTLQRRCSWKKSLAVGGLAGLGTGLTGAALIAGTAKGAVIGAAIGSAIPGVGTAVGAVIGALGGSTAAIIGTGALAGLLTGGVLGVSAKATYRGGKQLQRFGQWAAQDWRPSRNAAAAGPHEPATVDSPSALVPRRVDNVSCSPEFATRVEELINQRAQDNGASLADVHGVLPRRMQKDVGRVDVTLDGKPLMDVQSSDQMELSQNVSADVRHDRDLRFACSVLNQGLFRAVVDVMGESLIPADNALLPRPANPLGFDGIPQDMPQPLQWIDQQSRDLQMRLSSNGGDDNAPLQQQLQEVQGLGYHVDLQPSADGKYRFTARSRMPLPGIGVHDPARGMRNVAADPIHSRFACEIVGTFDAANRKSPVELDEGYPKLTMKFTPGDHEENPLANFNQLSLTAFDENIRMAVESTGHRVMHNGQEVWLPPTEAERRFRTWGLQAMTRHEISVREELQSPLGDGEWVQNLLDGSARLLAESFTKVSEARSSSDAYNSHKVFAEKAAVNLLYVVSEDPTDEQAIAAATVDVLVKSRLYSIAKVQVGLGKTWEDEVQTDLAAIIKTARGRFAATSLKRWDNRRGIAKGYTRAENQVRRLLVRLEQLSVRPGEDAATSEMYQQLGRTLQLACETFSLSRPREDKHPLDDAWRKLHAEATSVDGRRRQPDLYTADAILQEIPRAHAHFLACDYELRGRAASAALESTVPLDHGDAKSTRKSGPRKQGQNPLIDLTYGPLNPERQPSLDIATLSEAADSPAAPNSVAAPNSPAAGLSNAAPFNEAAPADPLPPWFESEVKQAVDRSFRRNMQDYELFRAMSSQEKPFRIRGLRAMAGPTFADRWKSNASSLNGGRASKPEQDLLDLAANILANESRSVAQARAAEDNKDLGEQAVDAAEQLLRWVQLIPPDQAHIAVAAVELLIKSRLYTLARKGRRGVADEGEYMNDLTQIMQQARLQTNADGELLWKHRTAIAKRFQKPENPVHALLVRLTALSERPDGDAVESAMHRQTCRALQLACETFSLEEPILPDAPPNDLWQGLQAEAAEAADPQTARVLRRCTPRAHAHFLACEHQLSGPATH